MSPRRAGPPPPLDLAALEAVAEELYSLPPSVFTATRTQRVAEARGRGERALASAVGALRRPTAAAWLANLLVHEERGRVDELLALGDALREAQAGLEGEALRQLTVQRHRVVSALAAEARALSARHGEPVSADAAEQLERTLEAAMADPAAAEALRSGRLTSGLQYAGLGELAGASVAVPGRAAAPVRERAAQPERDRAERDRAERERAERDRAERDRSDRERAEAERALADAEAALREAERHVETEREAATRAVSHRAEAEGHVGELDRQLTALRERLRAAQADVEEAAGEERTRAAARDAAARGAEVARRRVEQARRRLAGLRDG